MIKNLKKVLHILQQSYINFNSKSIKKDKNIWVFGAIRGEKYMDNSKYIFEYVNKHTSVTAVWLSNNIDIIKYINNKGYLAFEMHSKNALYYAMHAKVAIVTHRGVNENADLPYYAFTKETKIIQLWHGIPLKKIAFDDKIHGFTQNESDFSYKIKQKIKKILFPFTDYINNPSLLLALSEESKNIFIKAFRVNPNFVHITGYPRNDSVLIKEIKKNNNIKKIIYMPTFRNKPGSSFDFFTNYGFNVDEFDNFLNQRNLKFYIKIHPFNKPSKAMLNQITSSKNIIFLEKDDIYEVLHTFSMLITDYSSVYFDYLLTNNPIIFTPFDKENYLTKDREFYFSYDEVTPGPHALNWKEIMHCIDDFLLNPKLFKDERKLMKDKFHLYQDNDSSKRVLKAIQKLL